MTHSLQIPESNLGASTRDRGTLVVEYRLANQLKENPFNARIHSHRQTRQIARSIETFGFIVPLLVTSDGLVIAGHGRLRAAKFLGYGVVPVIVLNDLTDAQLRAFMIADNKLTENATWDESLLVEQLKSLGEVELDFSLDVTGFEISEIDAMIEGLLPASKGDQDPADDLPQETNKLQVSQLDDLWQLGKHKSNVR